jgi:hypothetical protein
MDNTNELTLLKSNFKKVEDKHKDFFRQGTPRWPGEPHDLLRNHHKNIDNMPARTITLERLAFTDLPEDILNDLKAAFDAYKNGQGY